MGERKDDRISISLKGLRSRVNGFRPDAFWRQLTLAARIRSLIEYALEIDDSLKGLEVRINEFRSDSAWEEMSLAARIRVILEVGLNLVREPVVEQEKTIAQVVDIHWDLISDSGIDVSLRRLKEIRSGDRPSDDELVELATVLPYETQELNEFRRKEFGKNGNGKPTTQHV